MPRMRLTTLLVAVSFALVAVASPSATAGPAGGRVEWMEVFSPDGTIGRMPVRLPAVEPSASAMEVAAAEVVPIEINGSSATRFDLVFVGDGYTSTQLGLYHQHVQSKWNEIAAFEPFKSHRTQFNVWQVNVVSAQSGVDNDPTNGVSKSTALDMRFWCNNTERLLCVNQTKARQFAASVSDVDQVIALANSTKYGGAGGGVATASGGNAQAGQIAIHELGHSIGGLADEYDYGGGDCYPYGEPRELNVSRSTAAQMRANQTKWYRWLGQTSPDGGVVDTYQGGRYYKRCIYRPTSNSIMRSLGRQFNLPGREAMITAFYRETGVVEASSGQSIKSAGETLWVKTVGNASVTWQVDGVTVGTGPEFTPRGLAPGTHMVKAIVTDPTDAVRDEQARAQWMTRTLVWHVTT